MKLVSRTALSRHRAHTAVIVTFLMLMLTPAVLSGADRAQSEPVSPPFLKDHAESFKEFPPWWGTPPTVTEGIPCKDAGKCVACHEDNGKMDPSHALACVRCHGGDAEADEADTAHVGIIKDPGNLRIADKTCGKCHPDEVKRVMGSPMALAPRMINHTRFAFGAQKEPESLYATMDAGGLRVLPHPTVSKNLGDDLLRRSCLRCHLYTTGAERHGERRGLGCSACHVPAPNDSNGKPRHHTLVRNTGMTACLKCHNSNHVGADFVGLFEKDVPISSRSSSVNADQASRLYGAEQYRLSPDVHFKAGMQCTDCHTIEDIHGREEPSLSSRPRVSISCESCHVQGNHPAVLKHENGDMTLLKGEGRKIPLWNAASIPHRVEAHRKKLECSACHAAWSFQDYGLHLVPAERPDYRKWASIPLRNDPQIQDLLRRNLGAPSSPTGKDRLAPSPSSEWKDFSTKDWLNDEMQPGAWFSYFAGRRWERPPLGRNSRTKVSVMRPMFQYVLSHSDSEGKPVVAGQVPVTGGGFPALIFNPYTPHTTSRIGRTCNECHGNPKAAGLGERAAPKSADGSFQGLGLQIPGYGFQWDALVDEKGKPLQRSSRPGAGPLDRETIQTLLHPSDEYKKLRDEYLGKNEGR